LLFETGTIDIVTPDQTESGLLRTLRQRAFAPVDVASLVFFRIIFGLLLVMHVWRYYAEGRIAEYWLEPRFLFKYYAFSWVQPWPGHWLYIHWALLGLLGLFIALGFCYRLSAVLFCLGYTYTFLLEAARWVNHTYLICLLSFLLIFVPAHRAFSVDAWLRPRLRAQTAPAWTIWILCFQIGVVYFFAGVAKLLSPDWLHGEPMRVWFLIGDEPAAWVPFLTQPWVVYLFSYGSLLFDLFVVPCLLWKRTRAAAFCFAVVFHLINAEMFRIEIFPWLALAGTTLFFPPNWPRRVIGFFRRSAKLTSIEEAKLPPAWHRTLIFGFGALYVAIQILVPLRFLLNRGGIEWRTAEHRFSWRMLLEAHQVRSSFYVMDPNSFKIAQVRPEQFLTPEQLLRLGWRPDLLVQCAHHLAEEMPRMGPKPLRVEARVSASINGRKPQLIVDPNVDLAAEPLTLGRPRWLLEIHEPLPNPPPDPRDDVFEPKL
jgi:vitamin K-dependent gamma-carboxylase